MLQLTNHSDSSSRDQRHRRPDRDPSREPLTMVTLKGLKPQTEYIILVQAYNSFGAGPQSDGLLIKTREDGEQSGGRHTNNQSSHTRLLSLTCTSSSSLLLISSHAFLACLACLLACLPSPA